MNAEAPPDKIVVRAGRAELVLVFAQATLAIGAPRLRAACRCADCRRERIDRDADLDTCDATVADGHDRGIYPWSYLRELARGARLETEPRDAG